MIMKLFGGLTLASMILAGVATWRLDVALEENADLEADIFAWSTSVDFWTRQYDSLTVLYETRERDLDHLRRQNTANRELIEELNADECFDKTLPPGLVDIMRGGFADTTAPGVSSTPGDRDPSDARTGTGGWSDLEGSGRVLPGSPDSAQILQPGQATPRVNA